MQKPMPDPWCKQQTNSEIEHTKHGAVRHEVKNPVNTKSAVTNAQLGRAVRRAFERIDEDG